MHEMIATIYQLIIVVHLNLDRDEVITVRLQFMEEI